MDHADQHQPALRERGVAVQFPGQGLHEGIQQHAFGGPDPDRVDAAGIFLAEIELLLAGNRLHGDFRGPRICLGGLQKQAQRLQEEQGGGRFVLSGIV